MARRKIANRYIDIILLESDRHLGEKFELVRVKPIFAKNVLIPQGKAVLGTDMNLHNFKAKMEAAAKQKAKKAGDLQGLFTKIMDDNGIVFTMKANEKGVLYEKIDNNHIAARIKEIYSIDVEPHLFKMKKKLTMVGDYMVPFKYSTLEKDVAVIIKAEKNTKEATETSTEAQSA